MKEKNRMKAYGWVSRTIVEVLSNDVVDGESLASFSIYLKFGVLKAYCPDIASAKKITLYSSEVAPGVLGAEIEDEISSSFLDNWELLLAICKDVWSNAYSEDISWLKAWENLCKEILVDEQDKKQAFSDLLKVVNDHLEISDKASVVMQSMIKRTFELV